MALKRCFTLEEAAEYIGVGENTLRQVLAPNVENAANIVLIPPHAERVGKGNRAIWVFLREDLDAWKRVSRRRPRKRRKRSTGSAPMTPPPPALGVSHAQV